MLYSARAVVRLGRWLGYLVVTVVLYTLLKQET